MRHTNFALALLTAAVLSACGGSDNNDNNVTAAKPKFASEVVFGDSLSDVGTYRVGTIAALGGGEFTINSPTANNWTEIMSTNLGLGVSCAAVTGLKGIPTKPDGTPTGFSIPVTANANCTNYAQGGARVTDPFGPGNARYNPTVGMMTSPVVAQVTDHLARKGGKFNATDVVFVWAGANDLLQMLTDLETASKSAGATAYAGVLIPRLVAGTSTPGTAAAPIQTAFTNELIATGSLPSATAKAFAQAGALGFVTIGQAAVQAPIVAEATAAANKAGTDFGAANGPALVTKMSVAALELSNIVRTQIVANGAKYVVVNNLPEVAQTPAGKSKSESTQTLIAGMVSAFNLALAANLDDLKANVLVVDLYTISLDQFANPSKYGLSNVTGVACGNNPLGGTSLVCNPSNLVTGVTADTTYLYADSVHPTPYGHTLVAKAVSDAMKARGWL